MKHSTRPCIMRNIFANSMKVSNKDSLNHLKKLVQQHTGQTTTYREDCEKEIEENNETIETLRNEILKMRLISRSPNANNEYLMRQALRDYHTGSSIFREREPRDVNDSVDNKLCDLRKKLNFLCHSRRRKNAHLQRLLETFHEAAEDDACREIEGPAGDSLCLSLDNHISEREKERLDAEMLQHTYKHVRDQLAMEGLTHENKIQTLLKLLRHHEEELAICENAATEAVKRNLMANADTFNKEYLLHNDRKERSLHISEMKKRTDERKHELAQLWRRIQAYFAAHEAMPIGHSISSHIKTSSGSNDERTVEEILQDFKDDFEILRSVTGSLRHWDVLEQFETQQTTHQHLASFVRELEVKKTNLLKRLEALVNTTSQAAYKVESRQDIQLKTASGDNRAVKLSSSEIKWSMVAADNRVTQTLSRLRQLLEYVVDVLVGAKLMVPPPAHDPADTEIHLSTILAATVDGVASLVAAVGGRDIQKVQLAAAAAPFIMTKSEEKMHVPRVSVGPDEDESAFGASLDDGETTGEDAAIPSRGAIKRQALIILQSKQKHPGASRKKT